MAYDATSLGTLRRGDATRLGHFRRSRGDPPRRLSGSDRYGPLAARRFAPEKHKRRASAAIARSIIARARPGLVAKTIPGGTWAAAIRAGSSVQALGK